MCEPYKGIMGNNKKLETKTKHQIYETHMNYNTAVERQEIL